MNNNIFKKELNIRRLMSYWSSPFTKSFGKLLLQSVLIIMILSVNIFSAGQNPSIILIGKLGAEYSLNEDISITHNNPFIPTVSAGFEIPSLDFLHVYCNYNYARKMGHPYMVSTTIHLDSNLNVESIEEEKWVDKDGEYLIKKTQVIIGLKGKLKVSDGTYINIGAGISPYFRGLYDSKESTGGRAIAKERGFAGYVFSLEFEKYLKDNLLIRFSTDYLKIREDILGLILTKSSPSFYFQVGYKLKIKSPE
ncbi:MAG: hypothetical protein GX870_06050 [Candidatus Marinimicrobia bacterium]|nr:hypothetical protein [Candidatus Neomarinimicrobiota bacterium]